MKGFKEFIFTDVENQKISLSTCCQGVCLWGILTLIDISFSANYHQRTFIVLKNCVLSALLES